LLRNRVQTDQWVDSISGNFEVIIRGYLCKCRVNVKIFYFLMRWTFHYWMASKYFDIILNWKKPKKSKIIKPFIKSIKLLIYKIVMNSNQNKVYYKFIFKTIKICL
jgi:hypothetical protein